MPGPDRARLKAIADETLKVIKKAEIYDPINHSTFDLQPSLRLMMDNTVFYRAESRSLGQWPTSRPSVMQPTPVAVEFQKKTTLEGARYILGSHYGSSTGAPKLGVLNYASATKPGGGWRTGASAQEESLARSSTLALSLERSEQAKPFYDLHKKDSYHGWYTDAMIWTPHVTIFRDDNGGWVKPFEAAFVTAAAVNAKELRATEHLKHERRLDQWIEETMRDRMGRILAVFEFRCCTDLVLGAFGTGVFQNDVAMVGRLWGELLHDRKARFRKSFRSVVFAIPDQKTLDTFQRGFEGDGDRSRSSSKGPGKG